MRHAAMVLVAGLLAACESTQAIPAPDDSRLPHSDSSEPGRMGGNGDAEFERIQRSTRSSLQWKRYATFESDVASALHLQPAELCNEFGLEPCIRGVHLGPLGGHDIRTGLLESPPEPLVTTATVVERVVLSACLASIAKYDADPAGPFAAMSLTGPAPAPGSDAAHDLVVALVRGFLARDPEPDELKELSALAQAADGKPRAASEFAAAVCLAVGSSTEFLFF